MRAPRDIDLGGILVDPFVRYLFFALVIMIAVPFAVGRLGLRSMFANLRLRRRPCTSDTRVSHRILDPSDRRVF
jgi:hypothetical protein